MGLMGWAHEHSGFHKKIIGAPQYQVWDHKIDIPDFFNWAHGLDTPAQWFGKMKI
jgi:hypothetical protein